MRLYNGVDCFTKANLRNAMDVHQSKCSGLSLFSRGSLSSTLESLRNVLRHRSLSACVIVSYLKQVVWKEFMAKPSTELLERAFLALSHLCRQMKICDDCSLIDIDASF